ncbi:S9 family peptidase [Steroidobacter flavus]|uniref:S9 family peptidase n=1 Tax=Steroidobacter flavus TaxID=1842136 RepID=A0ABV8SQ25_9GAMM
MRSIFGACAVLALACSMQAMASSTPSRAGLTLDDVFKNSVLSEAAVSPDGEWIAATVIRPVDENGVYGRSFYEMDVTRADVWLISRRTGERTNITQGGADASGFWCASWSPDGSRLALMSTKPEGGEPRGGDNVRLYVWEREGGGFKRLTSRAIASQTMGGSAMYRVELQGQKKRDPARCSNEENAPFIWLDDTSLLAIVLPEGAVSGIMDAYTRALSHAGTTLTELREGKVATVTESESGVAPAPSPTASLQVIDAKSGTARTVAEVPLHPFESDLQISVAPNGRSIAVLASKGAIAHENGKSFAYPYSDWQMRKQLGFADVQGHVARWVEDLPASAKYPMDLQSWSPDSSVIAMRARSDAQTRALTLMSVSPRDLSMTRISPEGTSVAASAVGAGLPGSSSVLFVDDGRLVARALKSAEELAPWDWYRAKMRGLPMPRADWWAFSRGRAPVNLTASMKTPPDALFATRDKARYVGIADDALWALDLRSGKATKLASELPAGANVIWPSAIDASNRPTSEMIVAGRANDGVRPLVHVTLIEGKATVQPLKPPTDKAEFRKYDAEHSLALFHDVNFTGTFLWSLHVKSGQSQKIMALNEHWANVDPGESRLIDYRGIDGQELKGAVLVPPNYQPGRKYPVLTWVYAGSTVRGSADDAFDLNAPGQYNLRLYAALGYVVLVPSMPLRPDGQKNDDYIDLPKGVMPALDRLIELGIADPNRLAVMGQSYGGYSVYSLVTYTNRFKAAIAMAGLTDLVAAYGEFDRTARGYPGIEHQKSVNWGLSEQGQVSMGVPPWEDQWHYWRNSPINYVDRVETPLLMIHGEQDIRGPMTQAEAFFFGLYRQGKRAKLLRYWGEDHGLRQSPANIRDMYEQIVAWLKTNLPEQ